MPAGRRPVECELDAAPTAMQYGRQRGLERLQGGLGARVVLISGAAVTPTFLDTKLSALVTATMVATDYRSFYRLVRGSIRESSNICDGCCLLRARGRAASIHEESDDHDRQDQRLCAQGLL